MRITEEEMAERKDKILHVAYELFCKHGIDAITLSQIAKESGVGLSTIYRYFNTKGELLLQTQKILWEETVEQIRANNWNQLPSAKNGWEEMSILLYGYKAFYEQHGCYLLFAMDYKMYLVRHGIKLPQYIYDSIAWPIQKLFCAALKRGQEDGSINKKETVYNQFAEIWGIMRGFAEQLVILDVIYDGPNTGQMLFDRIIHYILEGLRNQPKGM